VPALLFYPPEANKISDCYIFNEKFSSQKQFKEEIFENLRDDDALQVNQDTFKLSLQPLIKQGKTLIILFYEDN